jgi:hypothetical protein
VGRASEKRWKGKGGGLDFADSAELAHLLAGDKLRLVLRGEKKESRFVSSGLASPICMVSGIQNDRIVEKTE